MCADRNGWAFLFLYITVSSFIVGLLLIVVDTWLSKKVVITVPLPAEAPAAAEDDVVLAPETPRRPTHTTCLRAILDAGETPVWREKAIGLVEVGDADYHHFVLEILARDGGFTSLFEIDIADPHAVTEAHPFIVLRLSVKTHPQPKL